MRHHTIYKSLVQATSTSTAQNRLRTGYREELLSSAHDYRAEGHEVLEQLSESDVYTLADEP